DPRSGHAHEHVDRGATRRRDRLSCPARHSGVRGRWPRLARSLVSSWRGELVTSPTALLEGRRGLVFGVSGENSVGYRFATAAAELGAAVAIGHRAGRRERGSMLAERLGAVRVEFEATDEGSIEAAFARVGSEF